MCVGTRKLPGGDLHRERRGYTKRSAKLSDGVTGMHLDMSPLGAGKLSTGFVIILYLGKCCINIYSPKQCYFQTKQKKLLRSKPGNPDF